MVPVTLVLVRVAEEDTSQFLHVLLAHMRSVDRPEACHASPLSVENQVARPINNP